MATFGTSYLQWSKKKPARPVTYVCGPEAVLARLVAAEHRDGAPPGQCSSVWAGEVPESEVWDALLTMPPAGGRRVTVWDAQKLKRAADYLPVLAAGEGLETTVAVLVSTAPDFETEGGALVPHLAVLQASRRGQLVRCCAPARLEDRIALVASWWPGASPVFAQDVLARCGSLERAWQACAQAQAAGLSPDAAGAAAVCHGQPGGSLADLLMAGRRARAVQAASLLGPGEIGAVIGLLASRLAAIEQIAAYTQTGMTAREAAGRARIDRYVAGLVIPYLSAYSPDRIRRCRLLLAGADAAWRRGARGGVPQSLVALW
jgi:hypothetical protein